MNNIITNKDKIILVNVLPPVAVTAGVAGEIAVVALLE